MAEQFAQALHDREPQAQPAMAVALLDAVELAEDVAALLLRNAGTTVADIDPQQVAAAAASDHDAARRRIAHRVGDEIE